LLRFARNDGDPAYSSIILCLVFLTAGLFPCGGIAAGEDHEAVSVQSIDEKSCDDMRRHHVLNGGFSSCGRLRLVRFSYINFRGETGNTGAIVVLDAVANQVLLLFEDLRRARFPIEKANLMNDYDGNDDRSMNDNNTSSFNDRNIAGSTRISLHAYGAAIDINPKINPFVVRGRNKIVKPKSGAAYLDRTAKKPGMAEPVKAIFADHGFTVWGGDWRNPTDYQHFQLRRDLAGKLIALPAEKAREYFESFVQSYRKCVAEAGEPRAEAAAKCGAKALN